MSDESDSPDRFTTPPELQAAALRLALSTDDYSPPDEVVGQSFAELQGASTAHEHLLSMRDSGEVVAAAWLRILPHRVASLSEPRHKTGFERALEPLVAEAARRAGSAGVDLCQSLIVPGNSVSAAALRANRFEQVSELLYLLSEDAGEAWVAEGDQRLVSADRISPVALIELIDRTYEGTLDCPRLNGLRRTRDVVEGYRQTGAPIPDGWLVACEADRPVGCVLLADHPRENQWELIYVGVAAEARGRGLGMRMTRHAQWRARQAGRERLVLAVDAANRPALGMYDRARFEFWLKRDIFLLPFGKTLEM